MKKVFVVGPKAKLEGVVSKLQELQVAHILDHKKGEYGLCDPLSQFEEVSSSLVELRSILAHLSLDMEARKHDFTLEGIKGELAPIKTEIAEVIEGIKKCEETVERVQDQQATLDKIHMLGVDPEHFIPARSISSFLGFIPDKSVLTKIKSLTDSVHTAVVQSGDKFLTAIFIDSSYSEKTSALLSGAGFTDLDISNIMDLKGKTHHLQVLLAKQKNTAQKDLVPLQQKLNDLENKHGHFLVDAEKFLSKEAEKAQAPLKFGSTKETFFLQAFIPELRYDEVVTALNKSSNENLHISEQELGDIEDVPIKLNNKGYAKPFEFFTGIFSMPRYDEYDPTLLIAITFPLFMGFMLGDVAYGAIIFLLFYWLRKKVPAGKDFFTAMMMAGIATMVFGAIFGEVLGFEPYSGLIVRTHDFNALMSIALIAGVVHVNFGLLLGFILEYKNHDLWHAITHKFSWVLIEIGGVLFLGPLMGLLTLESQVLYYAGMAVFLAGAYLLYKAEGFVGVMELPTIISHILSYARLMAVGLASVFIAVMVNQFSSFLVGKGLLFIPLAIIAFVIGQTFALALGILSPSLHSIRLHYVEFFTKFYQGGGKEYEPFGAEKEKSIL